MQLGLVSRVLGLFLLAYSATLLIPIAVSIWYHDGETGHFADALLVTLAAGVLLRLAGARAELQLRVHEGFIIVAMFWLVLSALASLPLHLGPHLSFTDSVFEATSAFTTTGATVMSHLDRLPPSVLIYRQQLQWFGGMGIIVLAVAVMPLLGVGGMQLYKAETPGPLKEEKITPRIAHGARSFWFLYAGLTAACALGYHAAGMPPFDAVAHSLSTVSTGGFSTHDASLGYFHSPAVEMVAEVFMLLGGINFSLHYAAVLRRSPRVYTQDPEVRGYLAVVVVVALLVGLELARTGFHGDWTEDVRAAVFQTVSVVTSTGFVTEDFSHWPDFIPALLLFASFIGGCAGSTAGGMKVIRILVMLKQSGRDLLRLVHPSVVRPLRVGRRVLPERVIEAIWGYFAAYVALFVLFMLALTAMDIDQVTAFSAVATCMNNLGPGLGRVATSFAGLPDAAKWVLVAAMLVGRLEIFTLLVLFTPAFWRR